VAAVRMLLPEDTSLQVCCILAHLYSLASYLLQIAIA
jgi:hypothetical protein